MICSGTHSLVRLARRLMQFLSFGVFSYYFYIFTARCYAERVIAMAKSSVRPSVTLRYRDHTGWNFSEIISPLVSVGCSLFADPNITNLVQGEHPEILTRIGEGHRKAAFGV